MPAAGCMRLQCFVCLRALAASVLCPASSPAPAYCLLLPPGICYWHVRPGLLAVAHLTPKPLLHGHPTAHLQASNQLQESTAELTITGPNLGAQLSADSGGVPFTFNPCDPGFVQWSHVMITHVSGQPPSLGATHPD